MNNLNLENIKIQNFMGYFGSVEYIFNNGLDLITGSNNAGKTTILRAINFALFGSVDKIPTKLLQNDTAKAKRKKMLVELYFTIHNTKYKVQRGTTSATFKIFKEENDEYILIDIDSTKALYQKRLLDILQIDKNKFNSLVSINNDTLGFLDNTLGGREKAFKEVVDTSIFNDVLNKARAEQKNIKEKLNKLELQKEHNLELISIEEENHKRNILHEETLYNESLKRIELQEDEIFELKNSLNSLDEEKSKALNDTKKSILEIEDTKNKAIETNNLINKEIIHLKDSIEVINDEIRDLEIKEEDSSSSLIEANEIDLEAKDVLINDLSKEVKSIESILENRMRNKISLKKTHELNVDIAQLKEEIILTKNKINEGIKSTEAQENDLLKEFNEKKDTKEKQYLKSLSSLENDINDYNSLLSKYHLEIKELKQDKEYINKKLNDAYICKECNTENPKVPLTETEELFLEDYDRKHSLVKASFLDTKKLYDKAQLNIKELKENYLSDIASLEDNYRKNVSLLKENSTNEIKELNSEIDNLNEKIASLVDVIENDVNKLDLEIQELNKDLNTAKDTYNKGLVGKEKLINSFSKELKLLKSSFEDKINKKKNEIKDIQDSIKDKENSLIIIGVLDNNISNLNDKIDFIEKSFIDKKKSLQDSIIKKETSIEKIYVKKEIESNIDDILESKKSIQKDIDFNTVEFNQYGTIISSFKTNNYSEKAVHKHMILLNEYIEKYLSEFEGGLSLTINDDFSEEIMIDGVPRIFNSLGNGYKMRLNFSILFAFVDLMGLNGVNLLLLDETLDGAVNFEGRMEILSLVEKISHNKNVIIISHNQEIKDNEIFNRVIEVQQNEDLVSSFVVS